MNLKGILIGIVVGLILTVLAFTIYKLVIQDNQLVPFQWDETRVDYKTSDNFKIVMNFSEKSIYVTYPNTSQNGDLYRGHWVNNKTFVVNREGPNELKFDVTFDVVVLRVNETPRAKFTRLKKQE